MSWMDLSDYLRIEETATARIDELRHVSRLGHLFRWDVARRIDDVIDYFGDARQEPRRASVSGCG
jgi:hypothetical protein